MNQKLSKYFDKTAITNIGVIAALKGNKGDVVIKFNDLKYDIDEKEPLLVEIDGYLVPFFIQENSVFYTKDGRISLRFDTINSNTEASQILKCDVYASNEDIIIDDELQDEEEDDFKYYDYDVFDQNDKLLGKITDFIDIPGNPIIKIISAFNEEILVPVNATEVLNENDTIRTLKITIPDGLIESLK